MFNINTFAENIAKNGYLQNSKYKILVNIPPIMAGKVVVPGNQVSQSDMTKLLTFRAAEARVPAVSLVADQEIRRYGIGPGQKLPFGARWDYVSFDFISDGHGHIWSFWYLWMNAIFGFAGNDNYRGGGSNNTLPDYQLEYNDRYATKITIIVYDNIGREVQKINLYDAYPKSMNEMKLSWDSRNDLLKIQVALNFKEMTIEGVGIKPTNNVTPRERQLSPSTVHTD